MIIVIVVAVVLVLVIGSAFLREFFYLNRCLDEKTLHDYQYGRIKKDHPKYQHIITHLSQCERCQDLLGDLQRGRPIEDHLVDK